MVDIESETGTQSPRQPPSAGGALVDDEFTPGQSGGAAWVWWGIEPWPRAVGVGSTVGSTGGDEYGCGDALGDRAAWPSGCDRIAMAGASAESHANLVHLS